MPAKAQDDRADKDFAAGRRFITQLRGFRRTDSFFKGQPRAFTDFNLWGRPRLLDEIIVGCSRMELGEEHEAFPGLLRSLVGQIEYINPRVSFGRFEILQVYNYLVDNAWKPLNPINGWKDICLDFVNEIADVTRDRHLSPSSFKYKDYVAVYKRLINAWIELKFGEGTYTQYIDCVKQSVLERAQGLEPHRDHPGSCAREKPKPDASQAAPAAQPTSREERERGQSQSRRGSNGGIPEQNRTAYDPRQDIRSRPPAAPMEERAGQGRGPVGGMRERINSYARHEPSFEPQHSEHGGFDYGPRQDIPFRPHPAPMEGRAGYDRAPGGMDRRASHHAQYEPSFEPPYLGHDRAEYGRGYDPSTRPNAAPMEGRAGYDRVPSSGAGGRIHPYPDREPPFHPQYYAREPVDNRAFRQRRATSGEADWR